MLTEIEKHIINQINVDEMTAFLQQLVQTNSENPPGNEKKTALLIARKLESFGCKTHLQFVEPDRPNVIGVLEGKKNETLLFNGHTDTVKAGTPASWTMDPFGGEIKEGYLYGRGACDMKAGLVAMIFAMEALQKSNVPLNKGIMFTGVIDEEVNFKGTHALIKENIIKDCRFGFVSEPTNLSVVTQHKGAIEYRASTSGTSVHSGRAYDGVNAITRMGRLIAALDAYNDKLACRKKDPVFLYPTLNIGTIKGGTGITFVPEYCEIEFDRQLLPGEDIKQVEIEIEQIISKLEHDNGFKTELIKTQQFNSWKIPESQPLVHWFKEVFEKTLARKPKVDGFNAYCEVELLSDAGIPSLVFGPGSIDRAHAPDEQVSIKHLIDAAKVYALFGHGFVSQNE